MLFTSRVGVGLKLSGFEPAWACGIELGPKFVKLSTSNFKLSELKVNWLDQACRMVEPGAFFLFNRIPKVDTGPSGTGLGPIQHLNKDNKIFLTSPT